MISYLNDNFSILNTSTNMETFKNQKQKLPCSYLNGKRSNGYKNEINNDSQHSSRWKNVEQLIDNESFFLKIKNGKLISI